MSLTYRIAVTALNRMAVAASGRTTTATLGRSMVAALGPCVLLLATVATVTPARGHAEHQRAFLSHYTKGADADKDFRKLARKAKCNLCHQGKEDRTNYNRYGEALLDHLTEADRKNKEKIVASLELVAAQPSDPEDPDSPTYAELIAEGKLPGGPLDEAKAEPPAP